MDKLTETYCYVDDFCKAYSAHIIKEEKKMYEKCVCSHTLSGIYFVDATTIEVCHVKRASSNKVFRGIAKKSKSSMGWYYGFKLHLVINDRGEIMALRPTMATTGERSIVDKMTALLQGKLYGDKGYISADLCEKLLKRGLQLFTRIKANMQNKLISTFDKIMLIGDF